MEEIVHPKGKIYYSMGEVCEIFGVNASLLRFWEEEFPILKIAKNSRGHRIYTTDDVDYLRLIYHLVKEQGMTLDGARRRMRQNRDSIKREAEVVEKLRSIRNMLAALKAELADEVVAIDVEDDDVAESAVVAESAACEAADVAAQEAVVAEPEEQQVAVVKPRTEELADFQMEMPSSEPQAEEPRKPRGQKVGTLIGGDLFSPEDIRLAVAKERSKEAKKQVIEQTLF